MKLHGICLVKNEGDFLERSLRHSAQFFERIYVFDNGSADNSWKIAERLGKELDAVVPFRSEDLDFRDGLRSIPFNHYREKAEAGDWWCRLDADEIYLEDPRTFLKEVPRRHHVVWSLHVQHYFCETDLRVWDENESGPAPLDDFTDLPRSYLANASEPRFFRHRPRLTWNEEQSWPAHLGVVHPRRIPVRHYQWRSPEQMQRRLDTRREAADRGYETFGHSLQSDWRDVIWNGQQLHFDRRDGFLGMAEGDLPRHLEALPVRWGKMALHGLGIWP